MDIQDFINLTNLISDSALASSDIGFLELQPPQQQQQQSVDPHQAPRSVDLGAGGDGRGSRHRTSVGADRRSPSNVTNASSVGQLSRQMMFNVGPATDLQGDVDISRNNVKKGPIKDWIGENGEAAGAPSSDPSITRSSPTAASRRPSTGDSNNSSNSSDPSVGAASSTGSVRDVTSFIQNFLPSSLSSAPIFAFGPSTSALFLGINEDNMQIKSEGPGKSLLTLALAIFLPSAGCLLRIATNAAQGRANRHPLQTLVHNRAPFWQSYAWYPNTFFQLMSENEEWALKWMTPSVCLLGAGSWLVASYFARSNKSFSIALAIYGCFVLTHWADCWIPDLNTSCKLRGAASAELFLTFFGFLRWSWLAGLSVIPALSFNTYLFYYTYKTKQRWRRHQEAIHGYASEVRNSNFVNGESNVELEAELARIIREIDIEEID